MTLEAEKQSWGNRLSAHWINTDLTGPSSHFAHCIWGHVCVHVCVCTCVCIWKAGTNIRCLSQFLPIFFICFESGSLSLHIALAVLELTM